MAVVSMSYLLEAGVHFGHQTKRWNQAYAALKEIAANGGKVLFVGTRKQASEAVKEEALRSNSYYVNERWLGGTLTNFKTIRRRVKRLEQIEKMEKDGTFELLPKKEVVHIKKEYAKLNKLLAGIRDMYKLPQAMFIVDPSKEEIAIREARKLNIPVFGIVDTNCDPDMVDYVIPGNDDAIRAVKLIVGVMNNAIVEANGGKIVDYSDSRKEEKGEEIMKKALETVKRKEDRKPKFDRKSDKRNIKSSEKVEKNPKEEKEVKAKEEVKSESKKAVKEDLTTKTVAELRELAKAKEVKGYSTMKKAELIEALK